MKVIYIITFPPAYEFSNNSIEPDFFWYNRKNDIIGIWRRDHGHLFAKDVKAANPGIEFEVWRPDYRTSIPLTHRFEDGVVHRSYPAQKVYFWKGLKPELCYTSKELIAAFESLIRENESRKDILCHMPMDFSYIGYVLLSMYQDKIPFFHTSHLNPALLNIELNTRNPIKYLHRLFIRRKYNIYKSLLGQIAVSRDRLELVQREVKKKVFLINSLNQFDFNWAKNRIDRHSARQNLNLPLDKTIFFSSCRLVPEKQVDKLLKTLSFFKDYEFLLIISGTGTPKYEKFLRDTAIDYGLESKVKFVGYLDKNLIEYYCATDFFVITSISEGGPGSGIKALSLEIPVITTNTGIVSTLLKEKNAGLIIEKTRPDSWVKEFDNIFNGMPIKTINSKELELEYNLDQFVHQLISCYQKTIENFRSISSCDT